LLDKLLHAGMQGARRRLRPQADALRLVRRRRLGLDLGRGGQAEGGRSRQGQGGFDKIAS